MKYIVLKMITIKCKRLYGRFPLMSGLFLKYTLQEVKRAFTGWSL